MATAFFPRKLPNIHAAFRINEPAWAAALTVDPNHIEAIVDALARLIDDSALRADLIERGYERAAAFTWDASAAHLRRVYLQLLG